MIYELTSLEPPIRIIELKSIPAAAFYQVAKCGQKWRVVKRSSGHACCICRSQDEAIQLAIALNQDQEKHPQEHYDSP